MDREQFLSKLQLNDELVPKRCTELYLKSNNLYITLQQLCPEEFGSISDRIKHIKYGGGYCEVCGARTNVHVSGKGFAKYCKEHFHEPKKNKRAHNNVAIQVEKVIELYEQGASFKHLENIFNVSNVTIKKKLIQYGYTNFRSHSENQKINAKRGFVCPKIVIDRSQLVEDYRINRLPILTLSKKYGCSQETIRRFLIQENCERDNRRSYIEQLIIDILTKHNISFTTNNKTIIPPYELDIVLPAHNVAIEINGLFYHSQFSGNKPKDYHHTKYKLTNEKGIKLLQFWESDIVEKIDIIESMILNSLKINTTKIDARKCLVRPIQNSLLRSFCNENHIQGQCGKNAKGLGLFHNNRLVSCIGYCEGKLETTIVRFCSLKGTNVRGAFTKLLVNVPGTTIKTYSSNDISNGDLYRNCGFILKSQTKSDMWYTDYKKIYNRQKYMKTKQPKLLEQYDSQLTEQQNMFNNGYDVINKSGTKTWVFTR